MATYQRSYTDPESLPATWTSTSKSYTEIFATQEYALYGSERLGIFHQTDSLAVIAFNTTGFGTDSTFLDKSSLDTLSQAAPPDTCGVAFYRGDKRFELSNHLGNVLAVISDRKLQTIDGDMSLGLYFSADIWSTRDYYPFGMGMGGRSWQQNEDYRFGFQGQEQDQEYYSGAVSYKYRVHDPRIGRFLSIDPLAPDYPHNSPYAFSENVVINAVELEGLEKKLLFTSGPENPSEGQSAEVSHGAYTNKDGSITSTGVHTSTAVYHGGSDSYGAGWYSPDDYVKVLAGIGANHAVFFGGSYEQRASSKLAALDEFKATEFVPNFFQDYFPIAEYAVDHALEGSASGRLVSIPIMDLLPAGMVMGALNRMARVSFSVGKTAQKGRAVDLVAGSEFAGPLRMADMPYSLMREGAYDGVKAASEYLKSQGVPRKYRLQVLQSFEIETISLKTADLSTHGLRFYDNIDAFASGRYLFPTFTSYTNRTGLALLPRWNKMTNLTQWRVRSGSTYIYGRASSQGGRFTGGGLQIYVPNTSNLIKP